MDREERRDDESREEWDDRLMTANMKEGYDIFRGDDRYLYRTLLSDLFREREVARRQEAEMFDQRMRFKEETFATRQRGSEQSIAHRDLAISQEWRDASRDNSPEA